MKHHRLTWSGLGLGVFALLWVIGSWAGCAAGDQFSGSSNTGTTSSSSGAGGATQECPGSTLCNGICTNTSFDPINCGSCGHACNQGEVCSAGQCGASCSGGTQVCNGACVDTQFDPANCGSCGHACAQGQYCSGGNCASQCLGGTQNCN